MNEEKDKNIKDNLEDVRVMETVAFNDSNLRDLFKKTQKIATAIFVITNFFDERDALKMSLRNSSLSLLKNTLNLDKGHYGHNFENTKLSKDIKNDFVEILSYLDISFYSGIISKMNYEILSIEILKTLQLADLIFQQNKNIQNDFFAKDFFEKNDQLDFDRHDLFINKKSENNFENLKKNSNDLNLSKLSSKNNFNPSQKDFNQNELNHKGHLNNNLSYKGHKNDFMSFINNQIGNNDKTENQKSKNDKRQLLSDQRNYYTENNLNASFLKKTKELKTNDRRSKIMSEIENKKEVTIKDILDKFTDISEKTIQRELLKMVEDGLLVKEGERRWSKYRIKK